MDRVVRAIFDTFVAQHDLAQAPEDEQFEHFCNYCIFSQQLDTELPVEELHAGGVDDTGIDGAAIVVNDRVVTDAEDLAGFLAQNVPLSIRFLFVQSKRSPSFSAGEASTFLFGVRDFFSPDPRLRRNPTIASLAEVSDLLYANSARMRPKLPSVQLFYVTTGNWQNDANILGRVDAEKQLLVETNLFSSVDFVALGAREIQDLYRQSQTGVSGEILFERHVVLPQMPGVTESYIGVVSAPEFLKLVTTEQGAIRKSVFYENIRDFQGYNQINTEIKATLDQEDDRKRFAIYNNGLTIVAKTLRRVGDRFHLDDYQIINGCQTSHVLFYNRSAIGQDTYIPLRLIVVEDREISEKAIKATNQQTQVKGIQLLAMGDFQKRLEDYFTSFPVEDRLYYERRAKQYSDTPVPVEKVRIVSIQTMIRAFAATMLDEPHSSHYTSRLDEVIGDRIFSGNHKLGPYYASAYALYRLEQLFRSRAIPSEFKPARYHMLMAARHRCIEHMPALHSNDAERVSLQFAARLRDAPLQIFQDTLGVIDMAVAGQDLDRSLAKRTAFTTAVRFALAQ